MINVVGSTPSKKINKPESLKKSAAAPAATPLIQTPHKPSKATKKILKTNNNKKLKIALGISFLILLILATIVGIILTRTKQDIRQQAYKAGGPRLSSCTEVCAGIAQGGINDLPCTCPAGCNKPEGSVVQPGQACGGQSGSKDCGDWGDEGDYACISATECVRCVSDGAGGFRADRNQPRNLCPSNQACYQPAVSPTLGAGFCGQAGHSEGRIPPPAPGAQTCNGIWCNSGGTNYCCWDQDGNGTYAWPDTCASGDTNCVTCSGTTITFNAAKSANCIGTYRGTSYLVNSNVSCKGGYSNGSPGEVSVTISSASETKTLSPGSQCGQIDIENACGVCKADGCSSTTTNTPTPTTTQTITPTITATITQTITPTITATITQTITPTITATITQTPTATPTPVPGECGSDCSTISCDSEAGLVCIESDAGSFCSEEEYQTACATVTDPDDSVALCCNAPTITPTETPTVTLTPTATATPVPGECGAECSAFSCSGDLACVYGADGGQYCTMLQYLAACEANATASNAANYCCTAPTNTPTPVPTTVVTTIECNDPCSSNADCSNPSHICYNNKCRLAQNPTDEYCRMPDGTTQVVVYVQPTQAPQQPVPPQEPIVAGPNWARIIQIGLAALAIGALLLLFL